METVVISGSRADRGPLWPVVEALKSNYLCLQEYKCANGEDVATATAVAINQVVDYHSRTDVQFDFGIVLGDRHVPTSVVDLDVSPIASEISSISARLRSGDQPS